MIEETSKYQNIVPSKAYSNKKFLEFELNSCFQNSPRYIGHELMVPDSGDFITLTHEKHSRALVRNNDEIVLISNICKHRQATILEGKGKVNSIVCPLHRWTYNLSGELIGTPHFTHPPHKHLERTPLFNWNGLLFEKESQINSILKKNPFADYFNFDRFVFSNINTHICNYNWKTFVEVYLDDYHVEAFHPGLGSFVNCNNLSWHFEKQFSVQAVGLSDLNKPTTPTYRKWNDSVIKSLGKKPPKFGAIWMLIYPNIMVEWYPETIVISTIHPLAVDKTLNITEFYYSEDVALFEKEFIKNQQNAYNETVLEDDEIAIRIDRGRNILAQKNLNENGPYHDILEAGIPHFYKYLSQNCNGLYNLKTEI
tara:strand:- start:3005 stop:4108 length:1104 start_codon:yes stop_codon:yes gene_type:complete